jgi:ABC-2 type transport system permease protein
MSTTSISEYYIGRLVSTQLLVAVKTMVLFFVAVIVFEFPVFSISTLLVFIGLLIVSNYIWFNVGFILGMVIRTEDVRDVIMQLITLPLTFLSNIYYPTQNLTGFLRIIVQYNPLTHVTTAIRTALLAEEQLHHGSCIMLGIYIVVISVVLLLFLKKHIIDHD